MQWNLKTIIQYIIFFGLAALLLWYVLKDIDIDTLLNKIKTADPFYIIAIGLVGILSIVARTIRWQILIEPVEEKRPKFFNTFMSIFIGYGLNFLTPRFGEVARCAILARYEKLSVDKLAGTMIAERLFDFLCLVMVCFITLSLSFTTITNYVSGSLAQLQSKFTPTVIAVLALIGAIGIAALVWLSKKSKGNQSPFFKIINNIKSGVLSVFQLKRAPEFVFHTVLIWTCYLFMTYLGFKGLSDTAHLDIKAGFNVLTLGSFGFILTPGGTGSYQLIVEKILTELYNINKLAASAYSNLSWALQNGILLFGAALSMLFFPIYNRKK
jgi:glycosyltransferase 2 family protein